MKTKMTKKEVKLQYYRRLSKALKAVANKRLIVGAYCRGGHYCALGALNKYDNGRANDFKYTQIDLDILDNLDILRHDIADTQFENDSFEGTATERYRHMVRWTNSKIRELTKNP